MLNGKTRLFPIVGDPIIYTRSPDRLTRSLSNRGHDAVCVPMQVSDRNFEDVMRGLSLIANVDGLVVTMPHKFSAYTFCITTSHSARRLRAVNVMRRHPDGSWHGDMLDGLAFVKAQKDNGVRLEGTRVLLLGAGGVGSAIALALLGSGVRQLIIHDTNKRRESQLIEILADVDPSRISVGAPDPAGCHLVCNATSLGMEEGDAIPLSADLLEPSIVVSDVIAGHGETPFLKAARAKGCRVVSGDQMIDAAQEMMLDFMLPMHSES